MNDNELNTPNEPSSDGPKRVPSFDELMGFAAPTAPSTGSDAAQETEESVAPEEGDTEPNIFSAPLAATSQNSIFDVEPQPAPAPQPEFRPEDLNGWAQPASGEEELAPLILPGFSPEPQRREPLPPLFQANATAEPPAAPKPAEPAAASAPSDLDIDAFPPTQPMPALSADPQPGVDSADDDTDGFAALGLGDLHDDTDEVETQQAAVVPPPVAAPAPAVPASDRAFAAPVVAAPVAAAPKPAQQTQPESKPAVAPVAATAPIAAAAAPVAAAASARAVIERQNAQRSDDDYEKISVTGGEGGPRKFLPWLIVGGGALIAIIASILVINALRGPAESDPTPAPAPTTTEPAETTEPAPSPTTTSPSPSAEPEPDDVPVVEVGPSWMIPITQWGLDVEKSQRLGTVTYDGLTDQSLRLEIELAQSLPESCAAARDGWGLEKAADGTLTAVRPMPRCQDADAAAVYDTIWGLVDHMAKSAKPIS